MSSASINYESQASSSVPISQTKERRNKKLTNLVMQHIKLPLHHCQIRVFTYLARAVQNGMSGGTFVGNFLFSSIQLDIRQSYPKDFGITAKFVIIILLIGVSTNVKDAVRGTVRCEEVDDGFEGRERFVWTLIPKVSICVKNERYT